MKNIRIANMGLSFLVEVAMWFAFGYWGFSFDNTALSWLLGIGVPLVTVVLWAIWAAPKSKTRLKQPKLLVFKMALFLLATAGLLQAGKATWAIVFFVSAIVNQALEYSTDNSHPKR
ncbi:YrdB family protein [Candidatus Saccharibacteria bacterium]|nr:YrdB family protein [Candidatus Saccharibacteria bacterium]